MTRPTNQPTTSLESVIRSLNEETCNVLALSKSNCTYCYDNIPQLNFYTETLDLNDIKIESINFPLSDYINHITKIVLKSNLVRRLEKNTFVSFKNLKELDLSDNAIELIEHFAFNGLIKLEILNLSFNKIRQLNKNILSGLDSLKEIHLYGNQIESIEPFTLNCLKDLESFVSGHNKIDLIE